LNAGWPANLRANPYVERDEKSSPHSLCGMGKLDPHFVGQVRGGLAALPSYSEALAME